MDPRVRGDDAERLSAPPCAPCHNSRIFLWPADRRPQPAALLWHLPCFISCTVKATTIDVGPIVFRRSSPSAFAAALLMSVCTLAHANPIQSIESIQGAAEKEVRALLPQDNAKYYVTAARLDSRLRLAACALPLEAFTPNNTAPGAKATVGVRCPGQSHGQSYWTVYVPVTVEIEAPILVLRRALARRSPVEPADVELQTRRLSGMQSAFISDLGNLSGRRLKRALPAGAPLTADVLVPDVLVRRGQQVTLLAASGPFEIRAQGLALSEGAANERVRVRNAASLKIVEGVVENASTVRVGL